MAVSYARFEKRTAPQFVSAMLLVVLFSLLACLLADAQGDVAMARCDHTVTVIGDIMYFIGGMTENSFYVNEFTMVNLTKSWDENGPEFERVVANGQPPPVARHSAVLGGVEGKSIVVFGGTTSDEQSSSLQVYDTLAKRWRVPTLYREPARRYEHSAVSDAGHMIVYGGLIAPPTEAASTYAADDFWVLDFDTRSFGEWSSFPSSATSPGRRTHHTASMVNGRMIIIGGFDAIGAMNEMDLVYYFDVNDMTWSHVETKGKAPTPRGDHTAIVYEGNIVIYGGETNEGEVVGDVAVLNTSTWTWSHPQTSNDPPARSKHSASLVDSSMIVAFGKLSSNLDSGVYILNLTNWNWSMNFIPETRETVPPPPTPPGGKGTDGEKPDEGGQGHSPSRNASKTVIIGLSAGVAFVSAMLIAAVVLIVYRRRQHRAPRASRSFEVDRTSSWDRDPDSRHNSNLPLMRNHTSLLTPPSTPHSPVFGHRRSSSQVRPSVHFDTNNGDSLVIPAAMTVEAAREHSLQRINGSMEDIGNGHTVQMAGGYIVPRASLTIANPDPVTA